jgi:hypothetical protein
MTININNATYGQPPYFDNSTLTFDPIGDEYNYGPLGFQPIGQNIAIQYGSSFGNSRQKFCIRRYVFQYKATNNVFLYYKTYEGTRGPSFYSAVNDVTGINEIILNQPSNEITGEDQPTYITNQILHSLFNFSSNDDYFFVEGAHFKTKEKIRTSLSSTWKPNFFKIYRYGKITDNNNILLLKQNSSINF